MKFPAGSLAAIAAKTPGDRSFDVRRLMLNTTQLDSGRFEESYTPNFVENRNTLPQFVENILDKLDDLREVVECDPTAEIDQEDRQLKNHDGYNNQNNAFSGDLDFGILSSACGVGRKCQEGLCVDVEGWNLKHRLNQRALQSNVEVVNSGPPVNSETAGSVPIETNGEDGIDSAAPIDANATVIESMQYACDYGGFVGYDCACDFDPELYLGNATCITPVQCTDQTSVCAVNVTDCYQTSYNLVLKGTPGVFDAELCLHFLTPFEQKVCYETSTVDYGESVLPQCKLSLDGQQCSSCDVYSYGDINCYNFDCGNTPFAGNGRGSMIGNTCILPAHTVGLYLSTYGCPSCNLCGETMEMTSPQVFMQLFNSTYECGYVQNVAMQGFFTTDSCAYFSNIAKDPCGCAIVEEEIEDVKITESPTSLFVDDGAICSICPDGVANPDGMLSMPGSKNISCSEIETAGLDGSIVGEELCEAVRDRAAGPCCGVAVSSVEEDIATEPPAEASCSLCGPGKTFTNDISTLVSVPTQGIYSCGELIEMGKKGTLDENGICLLVQLSANTACGCVAEGPTMAPTTVTVGEPYDVPSTSTATRISLAVALATGGVTAIVSHFLY